MGRRALYENAAELINLTKKYEGFLLDNVSLSVRQGSVTALTGDEGSGKSVFVNTMLGLYEKDFGSISFFDLEIENNEKSIKERIAVIFGDIPFYGGFDACDIRRIYEGLYSQWNDDEYEHQLQLFGIPKETKAGELSAEQRLKLQTACALSYDAELIVIDADPETDHTVFSEIIDACSIYARETGGSVLFTSRNPAAAGKYADTVYFINNGKILLAGKVKDLLADHGIIGCTEEFYREMDKSGVVSARLDGDNADVMISDRRDAYKYEVIHNGAILRPASLEEIRLFYMKKELKEWT